METMEIRRNAIAQLIDERGTVSFSQLKEMFPDVSEMTLRTDLKYLDDAKRILRVHGGAKSVKVLIGTDDFLQRKSVRNKEEKQIIAEKAVSLLRPDTTFYIDSGSTATAFAHCIPDQSYLIYTTGLSCAIELTALTRPTVMLPGGRLNRYSHSVSGIQAIRDLETVNFDQAFMGFVGFGYSSGFSCGNSDEAFLKQTAMHQAEQVIVLMDSSKVGVISSYGVCQLKDIDIIVSDGGLPGEFLAECEKHRVEVL